MDKVDKAMDEFTTKTASLASGASDSYRREKVRSIWIFRLAVYDILATLACGAEAKLPELLHPGYPSPSKAW
jgi:hypothetical protein